jgi:acyl-CoA oxidase
VSALAHLLDGDQREIRSRVRALLAQPHFTVEHDDDAEARRRRVLERCDELAAQGLGRLHLPRATGGDDDLAAYLAVIETLGLGDLSLLVAFGVQFGLFAGSLLQLGGDSHHRYLGPAGRLELAGCFAMTETDHGSNVRDLETVARYDPATEQFVVHTPHPGARKDYIGNALEARMAIVFARLETAGEDRMVHPFLVPLRDEDGRHRPGVAIEDCGAKAGLHGVGNARIGFDQVRVPRTSLLDRFGHVAADGTYSSPLHDPSARLLAMLGELIAGRVGIAAAAVSAAKVALTIAVRYGATRRQFGPSGEPETVILDYLTHQRRLLPALATTYALHFTARRAVSESVRALAKGTSDEDRRRAEALTAGVKVAATRHAVATAQACREGCGAQGYLAVNRLGPLRADLDVFSTFEGDNTVLLQQVARSLLTDFEAEFEEMSPVDLAGPLARHLARPLAARVAGVTTTDRAGPWNEREFQLSALRWRERHLLAGLARRLQRAIKAGTSAAGAFLEGQDHAVDTALAHVERVTAETFSSIVDGCPDDPLRPVLARLCDLYTLGRIEADRAWFLEHHYIGAAAARALRPAVNRLCGDLRADAVRLVDAFAIPGPLLGAPIAGYDSSARSSRSTVRNRSTDSR